MLNRFNHQIILLLVLDCLLLPLALFSSVLLRLGGWWDYRLTQYWWLFLVLPLWTIPLLIHLGLYKAIIKYLDERVIYIVFIGVSISVLILVAVVSFFTIDALPRTSIVIFWILALTYIGASRFILRGLMRRFALSDHNKAVLIYGAGSAGVQLILSLINGHEYTPLAFIDDDKKMWSKTVRGLSVYPPDKIDQLINTYKIKMVLLAIPSAPLHRRCQIVNQLENKNIYVKTLPGIDKLISGKIQVNDIQEIKIEDLLGRDQITPDLNLLKKNIFNKTVLVTGAGGSIGGELSRQIAKLHPLHLILFEISEYNLYHIEQQLKNKYPYLKISAILGSIIHKNQLSAAFSDYKIDLIYHAAAYKHVPMVEFNPLAGIMNNTLGTLMLVNLAITYQVPVMVLISTDKAVRPTNVMGASKRLSELILQSYAQSNNNQVSNTIFTIVRFGNVLGSSGSVVPLFRQQIANGGPITVTHPDIIRYFMTIPEAVELVIQAGNMAIGGEVFVLDMGMAIKIVDLAHKMIFLSGLTEKTELNPQGDIEIIYTGLRVGEKLFEELLIGNDAQATAHPRIMRANEEFIAHDFLIPQLNLLEQYILNNQTDLAISILSNLVKEFNYRGN